MNKPAADVASLISEDYRTMQEQLHQNPEYGVASVLYAPIVAEVIEAVGANEVLDYGAGKGRLAAALGQHIKRQLVIHHYDPAIPQWSAPRMDRINTINRIQTAALVPKPVHPVHSCCSDVF